MVSVLQEKNLFLVYSKNFFFFTWKLEKSDLKPNNIIRSLEFQLVENITSFLEVQVSDIDLCILLRNPSINVKKGQFTILISDGKDSIIHCKAASKHYFAQEEEEKEVEEEEESCIDLLKSLICGVPRFETYPIIITCISKEWTIDRESYIKSSKSLSHLNNLQELSSDFKKVLDQASFSDIILKVDGDNIKAHKSILQARSPVFNKMFTHETSDDPIAISDVGSATLKRLLQYLYTGTTENKCGFEETLELYYAADKYEVVSLRDCCQTELLNLLNVSNACVLFTLASRHSDESLKNKVVSFVKGNIKSVVHADSFDELDKEDMKLLMRLCV